VRLLLLAPPGAGPVSSPVTLHCGAAP